MTSPPSSLPSPALSTSSLSQPQSFSMAFQQARAPSAASAASTSTSGPLDYHDDLAGPSSYDVHGTPHASTAHPFPNHYLPPMTTSPPPHAPTYIPPPQHALPPDPIHQGGWGAPNSQWRGGPPQPPMPNTPGGGFTSPTYRMNGNVGPAGPGVPIIPTSAESFPGPHPSLSLSAAGVLPHPAALSHGRSGSLAGEGKERRRDRTRDDEKDEDDVVISTIFVVGFPDDMSEREFQNIFTFAPGFEAATLKFPSGTSRREPNAALFAELTQLAAAQGGQFPPSIPGSEQDPAMMGSLEDSFHSLQMSTQTTTSSVTTPSAAMSLTPSAPSTATLGPNAQQPTRRQTIGFARFKTRADALAAREALQGRRIDALTGATLKAEMAKKNLHTKRSTGGDDVFGMLIRSGRLGQLVTQQQQAQAGAPPSALPIQSPQQGVPPSLLPASSQAAAREAWDSWPNAAGLGPGGAPTPGEVVALKDRQSMPPPPVPTYAPQPPAPTSAPSASGDSPPLSVKSPVARPTDSRALLALAEEADELEGWNVGVVGMSGLDGFAGPTPPPGSTGRQSIPTQGGQPQGQQSIPPAQMQGIHQQQPPQQGYPPSYSGYGYIPPSGGFGMSPPGDDRLNMITTQNVNPADQNPPINTLYIGNLPAISPPTHPPNFLEESLRALFHRRPGFKRMSFRQKINGPMCFVEFEDIPHATLAIRDLYGNTLNGLVKGGIRLSYSKNSLGQRGNSHGQGVGNSVFGGIAHTVALAGMSGPAPLPPSSQVPPGPPGASGTGPQAMYPSSMPNSAPPLSASAGSSAVGISTKPPYDRRMSETSSLSPTAQPFNAPLPTSPRQRYFSTVAGGSGAPGAPTGGAQPTTIPKAPGASTSNPSSSFGNTSSTPGSEYIAGGGGTTPSSANAGSASVSAASSFHNHQAFSPIISPLSSPQWAPTPLGPTSLGWVSSTTPNGVANGAPGGSTVGGTTSSGPVSSNSSNGISGQGTSPGYPHPMAIGGGGLGGGMGVGGGVGANGTGYGFEAFASNSLNGAASAWGSNAGSL